VIVFIELLTILILLNVAYFLYFKNGDEL
jgi:hypothetical protein